MLVDTTTLLRRFEDSIPVFAVLLLWTLLSAVSHGPLAVGLRRAGLVMALLNVVVHGVSRSRVVEDGPPGNPDSVVAVLRDSARALAAALPWFLLALAVELVRPYTRFYWIESVASVAATAGLLTVVLYAVPVGAARLRRAI